MTQRGPKHVAIVIINCKLYIIIVCTLLVFYIIINSCTVINNVKLDIRL